MKRGLKWRLFCMKAVRPPCPSLNEKRIEMIYQPVALLLSPQSLNEKRIEILICSLSRGFCLLLCLNEKRIEILWMGVIWDAVRFQASMKRGLKFHHNSYANVEFGQMPQWKEDWNIPHISSHSHYLFSASMKRGLKSQVFPCTY